MSARAERDRDERAPAAATPRRVIARLRAQSAAQRVQRAGRRKPVGVAERGAAGRARSPSTR